MRPEVKFAWFSNELRSILPNGELRLARDPHRLGLDLYVIERRLPGSQHAAMIEQSRMLAGFERFIPVTVPGIGEVQYDTIPEWMIVHVCKSETCAHQPVQFSEHELSCYREPNSRDLMALRTWLYEFRDFAECSAVMESEFQKNQQHVKDEANLIVRKELQSSHVFRQLVFSDASKKVFKESPTSSLLIPETVQ